MPKSTRRQAIAFGSVGLLASTALPAAASHTTPALQLVFNAKITVAPPVESGTIDGKRKRFIPITGGTVNGPKLNGTILSGGGDWQAIHDDGLTEIFARYAIKADDGTVIQITNPGVRVAAPDIIKRLAAGEDVDPALYYFRSTPQFEVAKGKHDWLRRKIFIGRGIRRPDHVLLEVFEVG
jgi:Protein of unknown function (DUF3237)